MFGLLPGAGLGFTGAKLIAFGLGAVTTYELPVVTPPATGGGWYYPTVYDNAYSIRDDDEEILEILSIYFGVIE